MVSNLEPADGSVIQGLERLEVNFAEDQDEYRTLRAIRGKAPEVPVVSRWKLTEEQRQAVAAGADVLLSVWTFGRPLQPVLLAVAKDPTAEEYLESSGGVQL